MDCPSPLLEPAQAHGWLLPTSAADRCCVPPESSFGALLAQDHHVRKEAGLLEGEWVCGELRHPGQPPTPSQASEARLDFPGQMRHSTGLG